VTKQSLSSTLGTHASDDNAMPIAIKYKSVDCLYCCNGVSPGRVHNHTHGTQTCCCVKLNPRQKHTHAEVPSVISRACLSTLQHERQYPEVDTSV